MPTHEYPVHVSWKGDLQGEGTVRAERSGLEAPLSVPVEFKGPGNGSNPEELLTSAISGCYAMTYGLIAANRKLPVERLEVDSVGEVEQSGAQFKYTAITIRPVITLGSGATPEQVKGAEEMAHKADAYCIVTNAVRSNVRITVEPKVITA